MRGRSCGSTYDFFTRPLSKQFRGGGSHDRIEVAQEGPEPRCFPFRPELSQPLDDGHPRIARRFFLFSGDALQRGAKCARERLGRRAPLQLARGRPQQLIVLSAQGSHERIVACGACRAQQSTQGRQSGLADVVVVVQDEAAQRGHVVHDRGSARRIHANRPAWMADEAGHRDRRAVGRSLRQRNEGMRLALPCACRSRRACLRGEPIGYENFVLALIAERVHRVQKDVRFLVAERGHHERAALFRHPPPDPPFQGLEPDHRRSVREGLLEELDPACALDCGAGAGERESRKTSDFGLVVLDGCRDGVRVRALGRRQRRHRISTDCRRVGRSATDGNLPQRVERRLFEREQLAVQPRERLEAPKRTDSRRRTRRDRRREVSFGLPKLACRRVREPAERPIRGLRTGGRQRLDDSLGLLLRRHTRNRLAAQRKEERACGLLADTRVACVEVLQKVSDNVAALEATERAHSRPLNTDIAGSGEPRAAR